MTNVVINVGWSWLIGWISAIHPEYTHILHQCINTRFGARLISTPTPSELITNTQITPFNIGQSIQLEGFKEHEGQPLLQG